MSDLSPPEPTPEVRVAHCSEQPLTLICEQSCFAGGEVVIAVRSFPEEEYRYLFSAQEIAIACARLRLHGYSVDRKIAMNSKCSKVVLLIGEPSQTQLEVHARRLRNQPGEKEEHENERKD